MSKELLDEREFELINILGKGLASNQRELSQQMNMSLGMINMLLRRLISKGLIRIEQLNQKKVQYILTPQGFAEKMQKSVKYTINTINSITLIRQNLKDIVVALQNKNFTDFYLLGESDLTMLLEMAFREHFGREYNLHKINALTDFPGLNGQLLVCKEGFENGKCPVGAINVLEELAKIGMFKLTEV